MIGSPIILPAESTSPRKLSLLHHRGEVFAEGDDHDGYVLQIALTNAEAMACARALFRHTAGLAQGSAIDATLAEMAGVAVEGGQA